jgi:hypothetical protein
MSERMTDMTRDALAAYELSRMLAKHLTGRSVEVQGAALADLLAIWLAGHVNSDDPDHSDDIREALLEAHINAVRALIQIAYEGKVKPRLPRGQRR